jgi:hypothetical protein
MPYHVRLSVEGELDDEVSLDVDQTTLRRQFLEPYREGRPITVRGRTIEADSIRRLRISQSEAYSDELRREIIARDLAFGRSNDEIEDSRVAASAPDVTDTLITSPRAGVAIKRGERSVDQDDNTARAVFLVHGRWTEAVEVMRNFLTSLDLRVIEWNEARQAAKKAKRVQQPFIADILDAGLGMARAVVVFMTPDDLACVHPQLRASDETKEPLGGQPRPNVIFEAGMAWQGFRERTVLVEYGSLRGFSDLSGVYTIRLDNSPASLRNVVDDLKSAGCLVKDGGTRWMGFRFPSGLRQPTRDELGFEQPDSS